MASIVFKAGVANVDITPHLGGSLAGWMADRRSARVHDPLHARCLVLDNGQERIAIVVCDLCMIGSEQVEQARHLIHGHTGILTTNILIAATHTHSAATAVPLFQSEPDPAYQDWLVQRIADGVRSALASLQPAKIGWGTTQEPHLTFNRRYFMKTAPLWPHSFLEHADQVVMNPGYLNKDIIKPAGPIDPELSLLALQHSTGDPLAALGNFALHYIGTPSGDEISADYFGIWADEMSRLMNANCIDRENDPPPFLGMMSNGCSGDINAINVNEPPGVVPAYHPARKTARALATSAMKIWSQIDLLEWVPLTARETTLELHVRKPSREDVDRAKNVLSQAKDPLNLEQIYARENLLLADYPDTMKVVVQALRIGDLAIVTFPGEAFVELGLAIKKQSPFEQTLCIELANGYAGYIPTPEAHQLGGYETWRARSSYLEPEAGPKMVAKAIEMLTDLKSVSSGTTTSQAG